MNTPEVGRPVTIRPVDVNRSSDPASASRRTAAPSQLRVLVRQDPFFSKSHYCREVCAGIRIAAEPFAFEVIEITDAEELSSTSPVIALAPQTDDPVFEKLRHLEQPVVLINARDPALAWVDIDNVLGAQAVTDHLIRLGHTRILFVTGNGASQNAMDRLEGYRRALRAHGIADVPGLIINANFGIHDAQSAIRERLVQSQVFSAVFAGNDLMAVGAIRALTERGFAVPADIAVAGFDDADFASSFYIPLTTYRQPFRNLGFIACRAAIQAIRTGGRSTCQVELMGELVVRQSCGGTIIKAVPG